MEVGVKEENERGYFFYNVRMEIYFLFIGFVSL